MISNAQLRSIVGLEADDDSQDEILSSLERAAVAFIQNATGLHFGEVEETTIYLQGSGLRRLWLPQAASGTVTVLELPDAGDAGTAVTEASDDGFVVRGSQLVRKNGLTWNRDYEYAVTFPRGYEAGSEPDDIRQLVMDLVSAKYAQRGKEGMKSETLGRYSYTFGDGDLSTIMGAKDVIGHYRAPVIA